MTLQCFPLEEGTMLGQIIDGGLEARKRIKEKEQQEERRKEELLEKQQQEERRKEELIEKEQQEDRKNN